MYMYIHIQRAQAPKISRERLSLLKQILQTRAVENEPAAGSFLLCLVGSFKLQVSFAKEPYKRDLSRAL